MVYAYYLSFKSFVNFRLGCTILEECRWFFDNGIIIMTTTDILPKHKKIKREGYKSRL